LLTDGAAVENIVDWRQSLAQTGDGGEMVQKLSQLVRQREVLRQQSILIAEALARTDDEIELLRAQAKATGVVLEQDAE
jgi:hypothetical protein